jgi:uncharacterized tellurite resistance protein B-like protein
MDAKTKSRFIALYCMVLADGIIDARELEVLYRIGRDTYGIPAEEINNAIRESGTSFLTPGTLNEKVTLLYHLAEITLADEDLDDSEKALLQKYALKMGFIEENAGKIADWLLEQARQKKSLEQVLNEINN